MALNPNERLQEAFSLALEDRSQGYADLVSNSNAILYLMKKRGQFKKFSGPSIRERLLYNETGSYTRYSGYQFLNPRPAELFNDAEFTAKLAAVSVTLSGEDILKNSGTNQLKDIMEEHISAAETELVDRFTEDLHSDGTQANQIGGLQMAIPTVVNAGVYGGISRVDNPIWRTASYDANSAFVGITQVNATTIKSIFDQIMIARSRGTKGPNVIVSSAEHYLAYTAATVAIQRINDENELGKLGFTNLKYYGAGKSVDVVLEGGIGSAMPSNVSYFIDTSALRFRYHPDRNFVKFGGKQAPINQDAIVQHIGFYGNLTLNNPLHMAKLYDSNPSA
ncbi:MAG: phage major capsid protein [Rhodobiaceae bacterium]|nr:phage major capsid protein [Rhodobiaceae bacterium]